MKNLKIVLFVVFNLLLFTESYSQNTFPSTGNVGIGTTTPNAWLDIRGDLYMSAGEGFRLYGNTDYFGQWLDGVIFEMQDGNSTNGNTDGGFVFRGFTPTDGLHQDWMVIKSTGKVGIGTLNPDYQLTVKGKIHAEEVKVDLSVPGPDYVFANDYELPSLRELQQYINKNKHLPNIPSAREMEANGVELGVMNMKLLEKVEELTLYTIAQEHKLEEMDSLKKRIEKLEKLLLK